ncbi:MAG: protein kinase [Chitinivibrionales bacterium]|nr:protein kinase [Chitinivibrionales bacterium]
MQFDGIEKDITVYPAVNRLALRRTIVMPDGSQPVALGSGTISNFLGSGGMANVYEIWNQRLEVYRAVKLMNPNCDEESLERFQTEIKICAKLHHPNIIEIHGVGEWNDLPYIEMEKIDGRTLEDLIRLRGALPVEVAVAIAIMAARGLKHAHNQEYVIYGKTYHGVIHRDLKPNNIMICTNGVAKIMDFGIARPTEASFHTMAGTVVGTLQYLSPEQMNGEILDVKTDIYAFGASLYEAITGKMAFPEKNIHKLVLDKSENRYIPLENYDIKIPARLRKLVHNCLLFDRNKRIDRVEAILAELDKVYCAMTGNSPQSIVRKYLDNEIKFGKLVIETKKRLPVLAIAAVIAFIVLGSGVYRLAHFLNRRNEEPAPIAQDSSITKLAVTGNPAGATSAQKDIARVGKPASPKPAAASRRNTPTLQTEKSKASESAQPKKLSLSEKLRRKYDTHNLLLIVENEYKAGNYQTVVSLFSKLDPNQAAATKAVVYTLRSLERQQSSGLADFLGTHRINDAEYYLIAARAAYKAGNIARAKELISRSLSAPKALITYTELKREAGYYLALCASREFDAAPDEEHYKKALEAWFNVKGQFVGNREHRYFQKAEAERKRIGARFRSLQG